MKAAFVAQERTIRTFMYAGCAGDGSQTGRRAVPVAARVAVGFGTVRQAE